MRTITPLLSGNLKPELKIALFQLPKLDDYRICTLIPVFDTLMALFNTPVNLTSKCLQL